jgi:hypothetical protein
MRRRASGVSWPSSRSGLKLALPTGWAMGDALAAGWGAERSWIFCC